MVLNFIVFEFTCKKNRKILIIVEIIFNFGKVRSHCSLTLPSPIADSAINLDYFCRFCLKINSVVRYLSSYELVRR